MKTKVIQDLNKDYLHSSHILKHSRKIVEYRTNQLPKNTAEYKKAIVEFLK